MREVKFSEVLKQYKIYHFVEDDTEYRQVTISIHKGVSFRGTKFGRDIGRKRQFVIDLEAYPNTFIFTRQGVQNGSYGIAPKEVHGCVVTENMPMFSIEPTLNPEYLEYYLQTNHFQDQLQALNASGSAQKSIHEKVLLQLNILLPDIEEQKSIVDEIKSVENKQSKVLEELQTQSKLINKLRSSILSDAVSGKIVPQDPNDESAEVLLEKIKTEKEKLIKEGKIKKQKPLQPIDEHEIPYELPDGWVWCRFGDSGLLERGKSKHRPRNDKRLYKDGHIPLVQTGDVSSAKKNNFFITTATAYYNDIGLEQSRLWAKGTLCITIAANIADIGFLDFDACFPDSVVGYQSFFDDFTRKYVSYYLMNAKADLIRFAPSTAQKNINLGILNELLFPLPPLEEQKRIVEKVEKLMATCDALELEVQNSKIETEKLMQSVLKEAFEK